MPPPPGLTAIPVACSEINTAASANGRRPTTPPNQGLKMNFKNKGCKVLGQEQEHGLTSRCPNVATCMAVSPPRCFGKIEEFLSAKNVLCLFYRESKAGLQKGRARGVDWDWIGRGV